MTTSKQEHGSKNGNGRRLKVGPDVRRFSGKTGTSYLVFHTHDGNFHVFQRIDARDAARDCGAGEASTGQEMWKELWKSPPASGKVMNEPGADVEGSPSLHFIPGRSPHTFHRGC